jgi:hypothetical protein
MDSAADDYERASWREYVMGFPGQNHYGFFALIPNTPSSLSIPIISGEREWSVK